MMFASRREMPPPGPRAGERGTTGRTTDAHPRVARLFLRAQPRLRGAVGLPHGDAAPRALTRGRLVDGRLDGWWTTSHRTGRFFRARRAAPEEKFFSTTIPRTSGAMAGSKRTRADAGADEIEEAELALVAQKAKVAGGGSNDASTAIAISTKGTTSSRLRGVKRTSSLDAPIMLLEGHADGVNGVKFSPDGTVLASCGADKVVNLWKVSGDCEARRASIDPIRRSVRRSDSSTPRSNQTNPTSVQFIRQPPHRRPPPPTPPPSPSTARRTT